MARYRRMIERLDEVREEREVGDIHTMALESIRLSDYQEFLNPDRITLIDDYAGFQRFITMVYQDLYHAVYGGPRAPERLAFALASQVLNAAYGGQDENGILSAFDCCVAGVQGGARGVINVIADYLRTVDIRAWEHESIEQNVNASNWQDRHQLMLQLLRSTRPGGELTPEDVDRAASMAGNYQSYVRFMAQRYNELRRRRLR